MATFDDNKTLAPGGKLTKRLVIQRLQDGQQHMKDFASKVGRAAKRYRDPAGVAYNSGDSKGGAQEQAVGEVNRMAINVRQLIAQTSYGIPDFIVKCGTQDNEEIARAFLRDTWEKNFWSRLLQQPLLFRFLGGMGWMAELWDPVDGYVLEHVHPRDVAYDPHTVDATWNRPRWACRRVYLPQEEAEARYGRRALEILEGDDVRVFNSRWTDTQQKPGAVEIWTYWDRTAEVEIFGDRILDARPNPYGKVPLIVLQGDLDPEGEFGLGHYDTALGAFEMHRRMQSVLNDIAQNGAGKTWIRKDLVDEDAQEAILNGEWSGPIPVVGASGEDAMGYTSTCEIPETLLAAMNMVGEGTDEDQGVTPSDRGSYGNDPKFATQAMLVAQRATARGAMLRKSFETFVNMIARSCVKMTAEYGLDPRMGEPSPDALAVWTALDDVLEVKVVEDSASWTDPAVEQQTTAETFTAVMGAMEVFLQLAGQGLIDKIPNPVAFLEDKLRANRRRQIDKYFIPLGMPGMGPGMGGAMMPGMPAPGGAGMAMAGAASGVGQEEQNGAKS